jgi:hypothetical protein
MTTMYDTASGPDSIPHDAQAVAGYTDGLYVTFPALVAAFHPRAHCVSITVEGGRAEFLDIETGNPIPPSGAGRWLDEQLAANVWRPGIYANMSTWQTSGLLIELEHYGHRIRRWVADWTGQPHIPAGFDACQWAGFPDSRPDISECLPSFFPAAPPPVDVHHYDWFLGTTIKLAGRQLNERQTVEEYDVKRRHPFIHRPRLHTLRGDMQLLAGRIETVAEEYHDKNGAPSMNLYHRQWRKGQLDRRAAGARLA